MIGRVSGRLVLGIVVGWTALAVQPAALPAGPSEPVIVMSGLDNPRGLAIGPEGALYVAEAGRGGTGPCSNVGGRGLSCYGPTGAISRRWGGQQSRVLKGLPSHSANPAGEANGPNDISFHGWLGAYITIGLGGPPADRGVPEFPEWKMFGTLVHVFPFGRPRIVADLAAYEGVKNPDGGRVDSNPFGLLGRPFARYVADAGGNSIVRVGLFGGVSTAAVLPRVAVTIPPPPPLPPDTDAVPTSIAQGPDGAYYIGQLTGFPFPPGAAKVYRLEPGEAPTVAHEEFRTIIDLDFGPDGSLYVLEHTSGPLLPPFSGPGRVVRVAPDGTRTCPVTGLTRPTSVLVDNKGTLYVTNHGVQPGLGQVLRVRHVSEHHGGC